MSGTDIILIAIFGCLLVIAYQLHRIGSHVDTVRANCLD